MLCREHEVAVRAQKDHVVSDADLCDHRIDSSNLHAGFATNVAELGSSNVIRAIRLQQGKRRKALDDLRAGLWPGKPLKQLLDDSD